MARNFHLPGRSATIAAEGMAATSHPLASLAAIDVLRAGGNAADAAVTAIAVLGVVEPHMTGIGGDCFCLVSQPGQPVWGYNGSGRAPAGISLEAMLAQKMTAIGADSVHSVTVPGAVAAWAEILKTFGKFDLSRALGPAIRYAEAGFAVAPRVAYDWALAVPRLRADPGCRKHYLVDDRAPDRGAIVQLPALAQTLRLIAAQGPQAFYEGPIADDIVATLAGRGGTMEADDLAAHRGAIVEPISANYRGLDVVEIPPNGQGIAALIMLKIIESFDFKALDVNGAERLHILLEAGRLAYAVRNTHIADPAFMQASAPALLDKAFARKLADQIDRSRRIKVPQAPKPGSHTVLVNVVDRERNAVSIINSLFAGFGSAIATEKTGIVLHNRGSGFVLERDHPNAIAPGKRPMHTIIPGLAMRGERCELAFGIMGGQYQSMGHAHFLSNLVDYAMDVQEAIDAPRLFFEGETIVVEQGVPVEAVMGLRQKGHEVALRPLPLGGGQAIKIDWERGTLIGGSDHRKDGCALGY